MAINVYLTLFHKYNSQRLRALEWIYLVFCYGLTFVVALVYLFIQTSRMGKMYGDATVRYLVLLAFQSVCSPNLLALVLGCTKMGIHAYRLGLWACLV